MRKLLIALLLLLLAPRAARAFTVIGADVTDVRVAIARSDDRVTRWYAITTTGPGLWIFPVGKGASIAAASPAWLEALDFVSAPRIVPSCGSARVEIARTIELGPDPRAPSVTLVTSAGDPALAPLDDRAALAALLGAYDLAVVRVDGRSATVRVVDREMDLAVPTSMLRTRSTVDVTVFVIGDERAAIGTIAPAPTNLRWYGATSDWILRRDAVLASSGAGAFLIESATMGVTEDRRASPGVIPSLALEYFARAASYGDATGSSVGCTNGARMVADARAPTLCARADLAGAPLPPCATSSALTCGARADDLALAVGDRAPRAAWITRLVGRMEPGRATDLRPVSFPGEPVEPLRVALASCASVAPPGNDVAPSSTWGGSGGCSSDTSVSSGSSDNCGSSTTDSSDSCGSSSGSASNDSCDSSSGSSDSCSSSSGGGDSCGGGSGSNDCSVASPRRHGRSPLSRALYAFALLALPLRRLTRRRT